MTTASTTLAILCGGRSLRLGSDKGLYQPLGDEPLVVRAIRLWSGDFAEVMVVVRDAAQEQLYEAAFAAHLTDDERAAVRLVRDALPESSGASGREPYAALVGVHSAVAHASHPWIMVVPVDQLGVRSLHLRRLLQHRLADATAFAHDASAASPDVLPFPSLWPRGMLSELSARICTLALGVRATLQDADATLVSAGEWWQELSVNGNTPDDLTAYFGKPLWDQLGRRLHYLRFSLTEACNLSCTYCLPEGFPEWHRHKAKLSSADIDVLLRAFRSLGFRKVRLTGGEPTVHRGCLDTVRLARRLGYERIAMTTNGLLMPDLKPWAEAGLGQINVSLDSLDPDKFAAVTKSREVAKVIKTIESAVELGLDVKINTVLLRSKNGDMANIESLIDWALDRKVSLRFIELMETKLNGSFAGSERVSGTEIAPLLAARGLKNHGWDAKRPDLRGPATDYSHPERPGQIGLINPMSCNFCSKCNRLRITAQGRLKLCLFGDQDLPLDLGSPEAAALNVRRLIDRKPERHYLEEGNVGNVATFRTIGG